MTKVKVFVYAADANMDADGRAMTLAPQTFVPISLKRHLNPSSFSALLQVGVQGNVHIVSNNIY